MEKNSISTFQDGQAGVDRNAGASNAAEKAGSMTEKVGEFVDGTKQQAKASVSTLRSLATDKAKEIFNAQIAAGAAWVGYVAESSHAAAKSLEPKSAPVADLLRNAGDNIQVLADNLRDRPIEELAQEASAFARRQPAAVL